MRTRLLVVAAALLLTRTAPRAQTTSDGVDAFLRGDYQTSGMILKPLADDVWQPDHVAEFFMAALYDNGLGIAADPMRACALYVRASSIPATPTSAAAMNLVRARQRSLGRDGFETCNWHASFGFDHHFEPTTIALDQGHWITWDLKGATIAYRGSEKRRNLPLASRGAVFLPLRHTELFTGQTHTERRHFIELFKWAPLAQPRTWNLTWMLFEVAGDELIPIATEQLLTATGEAPPAVAGHDPEEDARVTVNDQGDAEWTISSGSTRKTTRIERETERQERRSAEEQARARSAAAARVDYSRVLDVHRSPELVYSEGNADGCGDAFVFGWTTDRTEAITVRVDKPLLQGTRSASFDLASQVAGLDVSVHVYERPQRSWRFCSDVVVMPGPTETAWRAVGGTVSIDTSAPGIPGRPPFMFRAMIRISGAQFLSPSGARVVQTQPLVLTAIGGGFSG